MLELRNISKSYGKFSLENISFRVCDGDYFILLGESGAGKSLVLETIAGLITPDSGALILNGEDITGWTIQQRRIGLVFQDHAIFPHMSVADNIAYSLHGFSASRREKAERIRAIAAELGIEGLLPRKPGTLSGGELQRVALGRTLVQEPAVLLLDEPLSSLDTRLRTELRRLLRSIHRKGQTILHVTHEYEDAVSLGTNLAVIHQGKIIQSGAPADIFHHPKSDFVAHFTGVKNFFEVTIVTEGEKTFAVIPGDQRIRIMDEQAAGEGYILVRGEDILISEGPVETSATNRFRGRIADVVQSIAGIDVAIDTGAEFHALITHESLEKLNLRPGMECWIQFKATAVRFIGK
jgi:molybdopterin-binding protein